MSTPRIDLNCDLGEFPAPDARVRDLALLDIVTSANIACGGHAGDAESMSVIVHAAISRGVALGAHPSYPDRENFGRTHMELPPRELQRHIIDQIGALATIAHAAGHRLTHVKPHGALYHAATTDPTVAEAVAHAALALDPHLILVGLARSHGLDIWRRMGCRTAMEYFADRQYEPDGSLRSRSLPNALITDPAAAADQAVRRARAHPTPPDASPTSSVPATLCIHSDTPNALTIARAVRRELLSAGIQIQSLIPRRETPPSP